MGPGEDITPAQVGNIREPIPTINSAQHLPSIKSSREDAHTWESRFLPITRIPGLPPSAPSHQIHPQEDARVWEISSLALPSLPGCAVARILFVCLI